MKQESLDPHLRQEYYKVENKSLNKKIISQQRTINLLRSINRKLHSQVFRMKSKLKLSISNIRKPKTSSLLKGDLRDFLNKQLNTTTHPHGKRYSSNEKMFSLSLWHSSPKCYRLLRNTFSLPDISTLRRSIRMIDMKPGFHNRILEGIKEKVAQFNEHDRLVAIAFDEMSIQKSLNYNERLDCVLGYEDLGNDERSEKIASYATVFMVRSIQGSWKQPIGYFLTSGPMISLVIAEKLKLAIKHVKECGLVPKIVTCDQGPSNRGCYNILNVTEEQYFIYEHDKIFFLYDPPHLLKSIRNGLYNKGFIFKGHTITFDYIRDLYEIKRSENIEIAGKLTEKHVTLNTFSKMKVNYATQVLSQSVASGIRSVVMLSDKLPREALNTAEFCEFFNNLFDIFNSKGLSIVV